MVTVSSATVPRRGSEDDDPHLPGGRSSVAHRCCPDARAARVRAPGCLAAAPPRHGRSGLGRDRRGDAELRAHAHRGAGSAGVGRVRPVRRRERRGAPRPDRRPAPAPSASPGPHLAPRAGGGAGFVAAALVLGWLVVRAWRIGLNRRHRLPLALYLAAVTAVLVGGTFGALVGSGVWDDPALWGRLRSAHLTLNAPGWVTLTIAATLVTLLPTVLRVRMPSWHGAAAGVAWALGVAAIAGGLAAASSVLATVGGLTFAVGAIGIGWMVLK